MTNKTKELYTLWTSNIGKDNPLYSELESASEEEIYDMFYKELDFGTAGLRGKMGPGTNRMNYFTVSRASQALAVYLCKHFPFPSVAIAYDTRINSEAFAKCAAEILAANNVRVFLFPKIVPTPMLSYAVRYLGCSCGIMITASHNPKEYNGYKVYEPDGCQIGENTANEIQEIILNTDIFSGVKRFDFTQMMNFGRINYISSEVNEAFYKEAASRVIERDILRNSELKVLYTPLNGVGLESVTTVLGMLGVKNVSLVASQTQPDGNFPTCPKPNPEFTEAFSEALKEAEAVKPDIIIATDPDSDRVACAVLHNGEYFFPTGNEIGVLFIDYELKRLKVHGYLPPNPIIVRSLVSTPMADKVAAYHGCRMRKALTGFKNIAGLIRELDYLHLSDNFIMGFEESIGYMFGDFVRDKDAVTSSAVLCEMAAWYAKDGKTLKDALEDLYALHGYCKLHTDNYVYEGAQGAKIISDIMEHFRAEPPKQLGTKAVLKITDLLTGDIIENGRLCGKSEFPTSNVIVYELEDDCSAIVRPSGTEPKLKTYCCAVSHNSDEASHILSQICHDMANYCKK